MDLHLRDAFFASTHYVHSGRNALIGCFNLLILLLSILLYFRLRPTTSENERISQKQFWISHPMSGMRNEWLSWARVTLRSVFGTKAMVDNGYKSYSRVNRIFAVPSIDRGAYVVVPPQQLRAIYDLPESKLDVHWAQSETIQAKYTVGNPKIFDNNFHVNVIRNQITRNLDSLTAGITEQLAAGFKKHWGLEKSHWTSVPAWPSCLLVVAESINRVFVGHPQCQDQKYLEAAKWHANWVFSNAIFINSMPPILKPLVGSLVWLYGKRVRNKSIKPLVPLTTARIEEFLQNKRNPSQNWAPPNDGLHWLIEEAYKTGDQRLIDPYHIAHRLLILNFVSMHTTSFTLTNTLQDLFSSDPSIGIVEDLRQECLQVFNKIGGIWTQEAVSKLRLLDSTIRESMRFSSWSVLALPRRVVAAEGILIDDNVCIPQGIPLATPMDSIHFDPDFYTDPTRFHPFRYCTPAQVEGTRTQRFYKAQNQEIITSLTNRPSASTKGKSTVSLDDKFLSFGFGRHACPGRFFAMHEIKLMMAYILMNYEVEFFSQRPEQFRIMWAQLPKEGTHFKVRRRAEASW